MLCVRPWLGAGIKRKKGCRTQVVLGATAASRGFQTFRAARGSEKRLRPPFDFRMSDPFDDDGGLSGWLVAIKIEVAGAATARALDALKTSLAQSLFGAVALWTSGPGAVSQPRPASH